MKINLKELKTNIIQLIILACVCLIVVSSVALLMSTGKTLKISDLGSFGDFFGGVLNPIFSLLAFLALLTTIILQASELKATRKELKKSAKAQKKQSKSLKLQNKATKLQIFENTFFQLTDLFTNTKKDLILEIIRNKYFEQIGLGRRLTTLYPYYKCNGIDEKIEKEIEYKLYKGSNEVFYIYLLILRNYSKYDSFNNKYEKNIGTYFGQAYQVLNFIDDNDIKNKQRYVNIFRAQFTKDELEFLFYHCLGAIGKRRFKKLVEDYEFFEHIILNENIEKQLLEYGINAFGENENILRKYNELKEKAKTEEIPAFVKAE